MTRTETGRTHVHGFEPPVADGFEAKLHRLLVPQAVEPLAVDVALVHEDVPFAVVSRHEACVRKRWRRAYERLGACGEASRDTRAYPLTRERASKVLEHAGDE